jgi:thymidylate synthase (FAD)
MAHVVSPEAEAVLDREFPVLDRGFVRLVDYLGSDERIVAAARVSYGKGTKTQREDRGLIQYLMRHAHTSPFEQVVLTFHCKMPVFVARQWIRHRTARLNEISGRYSVMKDEFYLPSADSIRTQSAINKQGRSEQPVSPEVAGRTLSELEAGQRRAYTEYQGMLADGVARELARIHLPLSLYTEWYWQIDLHNLFHFLKLRLDEHAQWEIREYAKILSDLTRKVAPLAYEAFEDCTLRSETLSAEELTWVREHLKDTEGIPVQLPGKLGLPPQE